MYANKAYGRKWSGSVETEPIPELCSWILLLIEFVLPIYEKFWSLIDINMYTYPVLHWGKGVSHIRNGKEFCVRILRGWCGWIVCIIGCDQV